MVQFYDVSINDPELMDYPDGYLTKASYQTIQKCARKA